MVSNPVFYQFEFVNLLENTRRYSLCDISIACSASTGSCVRNVNVVSSKLINAEKKATGQLYMGTHTHVHVYTRISGSIELNFGERSIELAKKKI